MGRAGQLIGRRQSVRLTAIGALLPRVGAAALAPAAFV
jgi:hypothetical protein